MRNFYTRTALTLVVLAAVVSAGDDNPSSSVEYRSAFARVYQVVVAARTIRDYFNERQSENQAGNQRAYEAWLKSYQLSDVEANARKVLAGGEFKQIEERAKAQRPALFKMFDTLGPRLTTYPKFLEQTDTFHLDKKLPEELKLVSPAAGAETAGAGR